MTGQPSVLGSEPGGRIWNLPSPKVLTLITGGERSGKSSHAQMLAESLTDTPVYVATARVRDKDFAARVDLHRSDRDERWTTIEEEKHLGALDLAGKVAVVDCVTLWLANFWTDTQEDPDRSLSGAKAEFDLLADQKNATLVVVTNEIGMGVHASTENARKFVELQGFMNQYIARRADRVILMVAGIPVTVKGADDR